MVVQHNISAMTANRYYGVNNKGLAGSLEKLASGYAINKAGDNAAGLAVSEKMRAQIGGLTQASKNAEDGISLVQTMEGALQETDSILQRMRTLAVQSANGSYQDDVDREAMQLEFDQLNDELNQIADTDFNGTVMLNGGVMADGVKAHNGKIDYATKKDDVVNSLKQSLNDDVKSASQELNSAKIEYSKGKYDLSSNGDAPEWNTVDNSKYNKNVADNLWAAAGYSKKAAATGNDIVADTTKADTISVTFKYDNGSWVVDSATSYLNGEKVDDVTAKLKDGTNKLTITATSTATVAGASGDGGFAVAITGDVANLKAQDKTTDIKSEGKAAQALGNAIFDATNVTNGSTVTLTYTNGDSSMTAPNNIGFDQDSVKVNSVSTGDNKISAPTIALGGVADTAMSADVKALFDGLEGAEFSSTYTKGTLGVNSFVATIKGAGDTDAKTIVDDGTGSKLTLKDSDGNSHDYWIEGTANTGATIDIYAVKSDGTKNVDMKLATITSTAATADTEGTISAKISLDTAQYTAAKTATLTVGDDPNLGNSSKVTDAMNKAKDKLDAANEKLKTFNNLDSGKAEDWEKIKTMYAESQSSSGSAVSVSDSFDQSKATLTYTDQLGLQVGARTKDLVNFTFSYDSNGLGDLKANMNCSAREDGLGTAKLSISTQESANDAIDKIDNAINKISMVRATFGAAQNRLEHKINNIDTNTENLTAAESRIRDTQMDKEMMKFTSAQILSQASQSMLAQANQLPQGVLQLLG